jgi:signal transduction histidine kinase
VLSLLARTQRAYAAEVEANLAKSRILAQASHDLRQAIHAIGLFTACLRDAGLSEEQRQMVENIDRSLQSVSRLFRPAGGSEALARSPPRCSAIADRFALRA